MSESISIPEYEQPYYIQLTEIRQYLSTLKRDRKNFIKSKDVSNCYNKVLQILNQLELTRSSAAAAAAGTAGGEENEKEAPEPQSEPQQQQLQQQQLKAQSLLSQPEPNRVDYLIDDIFQLLSLCYMTVGLTQTAPATYASLSTVQRLLEHLEESGVYTNMELTPIKERLEKFAQIINSEQEEFDAKEWDMVDDVSVRESFDDENEYQVYKKEQQVLKTAKKDELKMLNNKLDKCLIQYQNLVDKISKISPELQEILSQLVGIRRNLMNLITRGSSSSSEGEDNDDDHVDQKHELNKLKAELKLLENSDRFNEVVTLKEDDEGATTLLNGLIDDCHTLASDLSVAKLESQVDPSLQDLYNELIKIKITLENLLVTRRWTLRETDLFNYQKLLQDIDNHREKGQFLNSQGLAPIKGQTILLYLLRRCYAIIYKLLESSEPISEALQPIHNQLSTVRRCLLDVKRMGGISSIRELYPYQLKLASIDNLRQDGKFMSDDQIPEGQGALNALLAECFDIVHELKIEYYENEEAETETGYDENIKGYAKDDENKKPLPNTKSDIIETTKSSTGRSDNYDDDDTEGEARKAELLFEEDDEEDEEEDEIDRDAYDLPSYAASEINDSEVPTDIEK